MPNVTQIVTGDAVVLDLRPARIPTRLLATAVDLTIVVLANLLIGYVVNAVGGSPALQQAAQIAGAVVVLFGYPIVTETLTRGRTVGALALGLRVVRDDGGAIRFRQALLRGLAFWTVDFAPWTGFCGGLVAAATNRDSKRLGDLMAGTIVVRTRSPRPPTALPAVDPALRSWTSQLELSRLPDELVTAARHLVQRSAGLLPYPRDTLAHDLARQVAARTAPAPPVPLPPLEFLAAVVAERRDREQHRLRARQWVPTAAELPAGWR